MRRQRRVDVGRRTRQSGVRRPSGYGVLPAENRAGRTVERRGSRIATESSRMALTNSMTSTTAGKTPKNAIAASHPTRSRARRARSRARHRRSHPGNHATTPLRAVAARGRASSTTRRIAAASAGSERLPPLRIPGLRADPEQHRQQPDQREARPGDRERHEQHDEVVQPHDRAQCQRRGDRARERARLVASPGEHDTAHEQRPADDERRRTWPTSPAARACAAMPTIE